MLSRQYFIGLMALPGAFAGVFVQGFADAGTCNQGVGSVTLTEDGVCVGFNTAFGAVSFAGGGSDSCFVQVFSEGGCVNRVATFGPINTPGLDGCNFGFNNNPTTAPDPANVIRSARMINCPE